MNFLGIGTVIESVGKVASDLITTDKERLQLELEGRKLDQAIDIAQIEVNKTEAQHASLFVAGWRPAIGWTCAMALFSYYVPYALIATMLWAYQVIQTGQMAQRPDLGIADLIGLVLALLGMSGLRSAEKVKGVAR